MPKILLVEDNELNREMLTRRLVRRGFEVLVAVDGVQGVAMAGSARPDLILMDMSLPGIDGWEATRLIKADTATRAVPVLALTAHAMSDDRAKALAAGCDDFDTKPVDLERLLGKIETLLKAKVLQLVPTERQPERQPELGSEPAPPGQALWARSLDLPAVAQSLPALQAAVDDLCTQAGLSRDLRADLQVVLDEVAANIFKHAYTPGASGAVQLALRHQGASATEPAAVELCFTDQGRPFNPLLQPAPDVALSAEERPIGGLGIHLVRQLTDRQAYSHSAAEGNRLTLFKHLKANA